MESYYSMVRLQLQTAWKIVCCCMMMMMIELISINFSNGKLIGKSSASKQANCSMFQFNFVLLLDIWNTKNGNNFDNFAYKSILVVSLPILTSSHALHRFLLNCFVLRNTERTHTHTRTDTIETSMQSYELTENVCIIRTYFCFCATKSTIKRMFAKY